MSKPRIVVWGTPQLTVAIAESLLDWADIVAIITTPNTPQGRKRILTPSPLKVFGENNSIAVYSPHSLKTPETSELLRTLSADIWLIIAYGKIIPQAILDIMPHRVLNIHPSRLPQYRGPSPIQASLRNGDKSTAISLMEIDHLMDHGPIIAQEEITISPTDTYIELEAKVITVAANILRRNLILFMNGEITPWVQDDNKASFVKMVQKMDGLIDWENQSAENIINAYRAYTIWPQVYTYLNTDKKVVFDILDLENIPNIKLNPGYWQLDSTSHNLIIGTKDGNIAVKELTVEGKKTITADSFANGYAGVYFVNRELL
jgi:methionyl-tRNA formyltransferase